MYTVKAEHQGPRRHSAVQIIIGGLSGKGGEDVTSKLHPYLISVQVIDSENEQDQCHIELDDRNAELQLPPDNVPMRVSMGWSGEGPRIPNRGRSSATGGQIAEVTEPFTLKFAKGEMPYGGPGMKLVFTGTVTEVESGFGRRGGGRRVWITGTSNNLLGRTKEVVHASEGIGSLDDVTPTAQIPLKQFMDKIFKESGVQVKLSPEMQKLTRGYWSSNQSPMDWAKEFAEKNGGIFKMAGGFAIMVGKNEGINVNDIPMPTVQAVWGVNLIGWRIKPYTARPQWAGAESKFFDLAKGEFNRVMKGIQAGGAPFGAASALAKFANTVVDKGVGEQANAGADASSRGRRGTGWVLINGEPEAKVTGTVLIAKARPGVDGKYQISEVEHNYTRGVGFTTRMNVKYPKPTTGGYGWHHSQKELPPFEGPHFPTTDEELARLREWYIERGLIAPSYLTKREEAPPPFEPGQGGEGDLTFPDNPPPTTPPDSYEPGQGGEGGIIFPQTFNRRRS